MGDNDKATTLNSDPAMNPPDAAALDKGKGKAVEETPATQELSMDEDEESSEEENGAEEMVRRTIFPSVPCRTVFFFPIFMYTC